MEYEAPALWCPPAAPSAVPTVHLMRSTADTLSLSWLPPEKPNGVILDYEIKYQERVSVGFLLLYVSGSLLFPAYKENICLLVQQLLYRQ